MDTLNATVLLQRTAELERQLAAKNRELEIEASLERVREQAMRMTKPDDVMGICKTMFKEFGSLGFDTLRNAIINFLDDEHNALLDYDYSDFAGAQIARIPYNANSTFERFQERVKSSKDAFAELIIEKEELESWKEMRRTSGEYDDPRLQDISTLYYYFYSIGVGAVGISTFSSLSEEKLRLLRRFRNVFDLAYKRYIDITTAEAQAREAQIQLALERVRARTMAMQRSEELSDVATVLFQQVKALGVPQWTCGFCIWEIGDTECMWYSGSPDGEILAPGRFPLTEHPVFKIMDESRKRGDELYILEKEGELQADHYRYMMTLPGIRELLQGMLDAGLTIPTFQIDHYANFAYGNLIFITYRHFPEMHDVFKRFAKVFEQTYTRFLDLKKAEAQAVRAEQDLIEIKAARKKAEDTLAALKAAQQQLIQAEKMASLGELTAGIAHEIQNPLNFVNNFSEINKELLDELKQEVQAGKPEAVLQITESLEANSNKISYHGRRAEAIVKSMLEHSRTSKGEKQPSDINALTEEYLRLAYNGLRAKDKDFTATVRTDFDAGIGKMNIVPQDIGRVLLNLFNNAFYAVYERLKKLGTGYEPTVWVSTRNLKDKIEISVRDNGMGISKSLQNKVFQPFFTTKPAGQGTGLGLSLSYDIIKAHGGEITVESKEGEGTMFNVYL